MVEPSPCRLRASQVHPAGWTNGRCSGDVLHRKLTVAVRREVPTTAPHCNSGDLSAGMKHGWDNGDALLGLSEGEQCVGRLALKHNIGLHVGDTAPRIEQSAERVVQHRSRGAREDGASKPISITPCAPTRAVCVLRAPEFRASQRGLELSFAPGTSGRAQGLAVWRPSGANGVTPQD